MRWLASAVADAVPHIRRQHPRPTAAAPFATGAAQDTGSTSHLPRVHAESLPSAHSTLPPTTDAHHTTPPAALPRAAAQVSSCADELAAKRVSNSREFVDATNGRIYKLIAGNAQSYAQAKAACAALSYPGFTGTGYPIVLNRCGAPPPPRLIHTGPRPVGLWLALTDPCVCCARRAPAAAAHQARFPSLSLQLHRAAGRGGLLPQAADLVHDVLAGAAPELGSCRHRCASRGRACCRGVRRRAAATAAVPCPLRPDQAAAAAAAAADAPAAHVQTLVPRPNILPTAHLLLLRTGTWSATGFIWEDGSTAPTELPSSQANLNADGYSHWVKQAGQSPEPQGDACVYSDRVSRWAAPAQALQRQSPDVPQLISTHPAACCRPPKPPCSAVPSTSSRLPQLPR
jgi:hypothetical protein